MKEITIAQAVKLSGLARTTILLYCGKQFKARKIDTQFLSYWLIDKVSFNDWLEARKAKVRT